MNFSDAENHIDVRMEDQQSPSWVRMTSKESSDENNKIKAVIICGPTASGKSSLAMELAREFGGQIVSADSRQVYRRLDIGTAKPSRADRSRIPHYLIDVANIDEYFTAKLYAEMAKKAIQQVHFQGNIPIIVGGAGLYLTALTKGLFEGPARNESLRKILEEKINKYGTSSLHSELAKIDPGSALMISPSDSVRIIRAIEIYELTGTKMSELKINGQYLTPNADFYWIGLDYPRNALYSRINDRVDMMIRDGLLSEIRSLMDDGLGPVLQNKKIVGYYEIIDAYEGRDSFENAVLLVKQHSRNYGKRQLTWFRNKAQVHWINPEEDKYLDKIKSRLGKFLGKIS